MPSVRVAGSPRNTHTFPEQPLSEGFPVYLLEENSWIIDSYIPKNDGFSIVGADFDDDGRLYLLERKLVLGLWWQNRVRRLQIRGLSADEIIWTGVRGEYNNLEGIAVWNDDTGLRIVMVSDNNADRSEATQFVEYRLVE